MTSSYLKNPAGRRNGNGDGGDAWEAEGSEWVGRPGSVRSRGVGLHELGLGEEEERYRTAEMD
jgi:hypothetical protein